MFSDDEIILTEETPTEDIESMLDEIEASADSAKQIVKEVAEKRKKKSETLLRFDVPDEDDPSIKVGIIKYINEQNYTEQDLFDYCIRISGGDEKIGRRLAYNTKSGLKELRNIRVDTLDLLCDFLNVDIKLEKRKEIEWPKQ